MTRQEVEQELLNSKKQNYILQLPTSFGKTLQAIKLLDKFKSQKILIVCPKLVLFETWKEEFIKWSKAEYIDKVTFSTYVSLKKHITENYDCIILDECHHITERSLEALQVMHKEHVICLSATIKKDTLYILQTLLPNNKFIRVSVKDAITEDVLPSPLVILLPLTLPKTEQIYTFVKNTKGKVKVECAFEDRWKYVKDKTKQVYIKCTAIQYYTLLVNNIDYYKKRYMQGGASFIKNLWLKSCLERLKFLAEIKEPITLEIQQAVQDNRTITFCSDIAQTERLGKNAINSKAGDSCEVLAKFNAGEIDHITTCNMCNEGINLVNCKIGIWAYMNASEIMTVQKLGRILRHKTPVAILPYYLGTREQELVQKFLENTDKKFIRVINNINQLKKV